MSKIAVICGFPRSLVNFRGDLLKAMRAAGHAVVAIGPAADAETLAFLSGHDIAYRSVDFERSSINPAADLMLFWGLRRALTQVRPDCVLAYTIKPVVYGMLAAASAGIGARCALITGLGYAFTDGDRPSLKRAAVRSAASLLYGASLRAATGVMFQNPDDAALFRSRRILPAGKASIIVPGSGVDTFAFAQAPVPDAPRFLMISRLVGDKGVREYMAAARHLFVRFPDAEFHLVGPLDPHPSAVALSEIDAACKVSNLTYYGETGDVRPYLARCQVYVLPSYREGMPRSVLEAMSVGRAIVTTDAPGCRETVVNGRNGFLVPPRDAGALADAIFRFKDAPDLARQMGQESRALAEEKFSVDAVSAAILEFCGLAARENKTDRSHPA